MAPARREPQRFSNWLAGLTVGAAGGFMLGIWPSLGAIVVAAFLGGVVRTTARAAAMGGLLIGLPSLWLALVGQATLTCQQFNSVPGQGCVAPDLRGWTLVTVCLLVVGVILTASAVRAPRRKAPE